MPSIAFCFRRYFKMRQKITDQHLKRFFSENNLTGEIKYYERLGRKIRYITIGNDHKPATLLFIPGSPASVDLYIDYYKDSLLLQNFRMFAVDRPGYGNSGYGDPEPSVEKQAEIIRPIIAEFQFVHRPLIICAGSYGATIACRLVMDHAGIADGLVIDGPSMAHGEEKMFWLAQIIENSFIRRLIPPHHRSSNTEKIHHKNELEKMLPYWEKIKIPVMYIQGSKDKMIYTSNADFAREKLINTPYLNVHFVPGRTHFIGRKERPLITKKILQMLQMLKK
jgi:pimeloyl-ACP methyl ester carboxylesterase